MQAHHTHLRTHNAAGVGIVEVIVVIAVLTASFAALVGGSALFIRSGLLSIDRTEAIFLAEEGLEVMRYLRNESFATNITPLIGAGAQYIEPNGSGWSVAATGTDIFGQFSRTVTVSSAYRRDTDDDIVPSTSSDPKTADPDTTLVTVVVTWGSSEVSAHTYLTNLYDN